MLRCLPPLRARISHATAALLALALAPVLGSARTQTGSEEAERGVAVEHEAPACVAAGEYARLSACFRPPQAVARGRVYFRPAGTSAKDWFYVEMTGDPPCLQGILPRPEKKLEGIEYYISAMDRQFAETRTEERTLQVTEDGTCPAG